METLETRVREEAPVDCDATVVGSLEELLPIPPSCRKAKEPRGALYVLERLTSGVLLSESVESIDTLAGDGAALDADANAEGSLGLTLPIPPSCAKANDSNAGFDVLERRKMAVSFVESSDVLVAGGIVDDSLEELFGIPPSCLRAKDPGGGFVVLEGRGGAVRVSCCDTWICGFEFDIPGGV